MKKGWERKRRFSNAQRFDFTVRRSIRPSPPPPSSDPISSPDFQKNAPSPSSSSTGLSVYANSDDRVDGEDLKNLSRT